MRETAYATTVKARFQRAFLFFAHTRAGLLIYGQTCGMIAADSREMLLRSGSRPCLSILTG